LRVSRVSLDTRASLSKLRAEALSLFSSIGVCDGRGGQITKEGIRAAFPQLDVEAAEQLMAEADNDYDGQVTFEEFWQVIVRFGSEEGEDTGLHPASWRGVDSEKGDEEQSEGGDESLLHHELRGLSALNLLAGSQIDGEEEDGEWEEED